MNATLGVNGPACKPEADRVRTPRRLFRIVDVFSGTTIVEDASTTTAVDTLTGVESIFDVLIYVWVPDLTLWRQLTPGEHRMLWGFRGR
jgi:hypothetical protein